MQYLGHFRLAYRVQFIAILTTSILLLSCSKNISPKFETQVYMPLVRGTFDLLDFIYAFAPGSLNIDPTDSNMTFFYTKDTVIDFIDPSQVFSNSTDTLPLPAVGISFDSLFAGISQVTISQLIPTLGDTPGVYTIGPFEKQIVRYVHLSDLDSAYYESALFQLNLANNPWFSLDTVSIKGVDSLSGNLLFKGEFTDLLPGQVQILQFQSHNKSIHRTIKLRWRFVNLTNQANIYVNPDDVFSVNFRGDSVHLWRGLLSLHGGKLHMFYRDTLHLSLPINLQSATIIGGTLSTEGSNELPLTVNYSLLLDETGTDVSFTLPPQSTRAIDYPMYGETYNSVEGFHNSVTFMVDGVTQPSEHVYIDSSKTLTTVVSLSGLQPGSISGELQHDLEVPLPAVKFPIVKNDTLLPSGILNIPGATMSIEPTINSTFSKSIYITLTGINNTTGEIAETTMVSNFTDVAVFSNLGSVLRVNPDTIMMEGSIIFTGSGNLMLDSQIPLKVDFVIPFEVEFSDQVLRVHSSRVYLKDPDARKVLKQSQLKTGTLYIFYKNSFTVPFELTIYMRGKKGFLVKKSGALTEGRTSSTGVTPVIDTLTISLKKRDLKIFKQFPIDLWFEVKSAEPGVYTLYGNSRLTYSVWVNIKGRITP